MLTYVLIAFVIAAAGGIVLAAFAFRARFAPWLVSVAHALAGAAGLVLLAFYVMAGSDGAAAAVPALVVLVIAALGGFYLASLHGRKQLAPTPAVLAHAGFAVIGVGILLKIFVGA